MSRADSKVALVMAAGHSQRWEPDYPKHVADLGGITVLERTLRQLWARGFGEDWHCIVVYRDEMVRNATYRAQRLLKTNRLLYYLTQQRQSFFVCAEVAAMAKLWAMKRTIVLLGDVVWSKAALDRLLDKDSPMAVVGTEAEVFGLSMVRKSYSRALELFRLRAGHAETRRRAILAGTETQAWPGMGKLWDFYRAWDGLSPEVHQIKHGGCFDVLPEEDYTIDLDREKDYRRFMETVVKPGLLEDV